MTPEEIVAFGTVEACQVAMSERLAAGDTLAYFRLRERWHELENASEPVQPAPEHTTRDPWPEGFMVPAGPMRLNTSARAAGWDTRTGYARSARKSVGRGAYRVHHYVIVQAAREGRSAWARWRCPVEGKPSWSFDAGQVNGWPVSTLTMVTDAIAAGGVGSET